MASLHALLTADHERLDHLLQELSDAAEGADQPTLREVWSRFEGGLLAHLDAEEEYLLPVLEPSEPEMVRQVRDEHAAIRHLVSELGVTTDLHMLRKEVADNLVRSLRDHAAYEDRTLYHRADDVLSDDNRASFRHFLHEEGERRYRESKARAAG